MPSTTLRSTLTLRRCRLVCSTLPPSSNLSCLRPAGKCCSLATGASAISSRSSSSLQPSPTASTYSSWSPTSLHDSAKRAAIDALTAQGVDVLHGDLEQDAVDTLAGLLRSASIDTIVSSVGATQLQLQLPLVAAAQAAGTVTHFIPSEFGWDTTAIRPIGIVAPVVSGKQRVQQALTAAGIPATLLFSGAFAELLVSPPFGFDLANNRVVAAGSFDARVNVSAMADVAFATAAVVLDPPSNGTRRLYLGEPVSYDVVTRLVDAARGEWGAPPLERVVLSVAEAERRVAANPAEFGARFAPLFASGEGVLWVAEQSYLKRAHPSHRLTPLADLISRQCENKRTAE